MSYPSDFNIWGYSPYRRLWDGYDPYTYNNPPTTRSKRMATTATPRKRATPLVGATPAKTTKPRTKAYPKPLTEKEQHEADIAFMAKELFKEAKKHDLCNEFNTVMQRVNKSLNVKMPEDIINPKLTYSLNFPSVRMSGAGWEGPAVSKNSYGDIVLETATRRHFEEALKKVVDDFMASYTPLTGTFKNVRGAVVSAGSYIHESK